MQQRLSIIQTNKNVAQSCKRYTRKDSLNTPYVGEAFNLQNSVHQREGTVVKYKTELCKNYSEKGYCPYRRKCQFAHGHQEMVSEHLLHSNAKFRTKKCKFYWIQGYCCYGSRCQFSHEVTISSETLCFLKIWKIALKQNNLKQGKSRVLNLLDRSNQALPK